MAGRHLQRLARRVGDRQGIRTEEPPLPLDDRHPALLQQLLHAAHQPLHGGPLVGHHPFQVGLGLGDTDSVLGGAAGTGEQFGRGDQRFGRNASDIQAGPADARFLHQCDAHPQLGGP